MLSTLCLNFAKKVMMDTMSNLQPEIARKKGEEFHNSIANFIQGILSPRKDEVAPDAAPKPALATSSNKTNVPKSNHTTVLSKTLATNNALAPSTVHTS